MSQVALIETQPELMPYRAVCRSAVLAVVLMGLGLPLVVLAAVSATIVVGDAVPLGTVGGVLGLAAAWLGWSAGRTIRRYPTECTGARLARSGLWGGLLLAAFGFSLAGYTHVTEVPEGYQRVGFWELQPDPEQPELPISPRALELAGQRIFIKGYMHPGVASMGRVDRFILVPDMGTCCFGGQPKPTDMIEVYVPDPSRRVAYAPRRIKLAGVFQLTDRPTQSLGLSGVWYHLVADDVR